MPPIMKDAPVRRGTSNSKRSRLLLVDGTMLCYRAYYAIRNLSNSRGEPTNAIYGFITMMQKMLADQNPEYLAVCFDLKGPTFRSEKFEDYKAHRKPMPDDLGEQMDSIREVCRGFRYAVFEEPGYEADDLIGTLAREAEAKGMDVIIATGDKDAMQLVNDHVLILNPNKEDGLFDREAVRKRFDGLGPEKVVEIMALMGDSSDNIPGVPGFGEKTAVKLIKKFGSRDAIYKDLSKVKAAKQRDLLIQNEKQARLSRELACIDKNVPIDLDWDQVRVTEADGEVLAELFRRFEFKSLLKQYMPRGEADQSKRCYEVINSAEKLDGFLKQLAKAKAFSFDTETTSEDPMKAHLVGLSFAWEPLCAFYVPLASEFHEGKGMPWPEVREKIRPFLEEGQHGIYGQNLKYDWIVMKRHGVHIRGLAFDTMIASYLINPVKFNHNLDDIALEYLQIKKIPTSELLGKGKNQITMDAVPLDVISQYACEDADCVWRLAPLLKQKLEENDLVRLFEEIEMPLLEVLAKMEMNGVNLDLKFLAKMSETASKDLEALTRDIYRLAGEEFNINSTRQLGQILFEKLKLPVVRRTKTGYSTDVNVLEKLAETYELPRAILLYREKAKLKSTYLDALPEMIHETTGRIHTSYNQATTATGRLSSSDPNLQNIPIKTEAGREIRKAFVPRPGEGRNGKIIAADYSQVELRILAHYSGDENLLRAFQEDRDIHSFTATLLYGVDEKNVTREMRNVAKTINFSIIYGKTAYGLSQDLEIPVPEADRFIREYFTRYAGIRDFLEAQKETARKQGYLTTLLNRRAFFPEINASNQQIRQFAERAAINAPIQGSAADLIKLAMIRIQNRLEKEYPESYLIMQVHDELVLDVPGRDTEAVAALVRQEMEGAMKLQVPLKVDLNIGESWFKN